MKNTIHFSAILLFGLLCFIPVDIQGQNFNLHDSPPSWIQHAWEGEKNIIPYAIDVNNNGELYAIKTIQDIDLHRINNNFIVKYNIDGSLLWERKGSIPNEKSRLFFNAFAGYDIAVQEDRLYINTGIPVTSPEYRYFYGGLMINIYSDSGDSLKSILLSPDDPEHYQYQPAVIKGIGVDQHENIYIAGIYDFVQASRSRDSLFSDPHKIGAFLPPSGHHDHISELGYPDIFMASYTPEGNIRWTRRIGGFGDDILFENLFRVDNVGNTYLMGNFRGFGEQHVIIGEGQPNEARLDYNTAFALSSFDANGILRWVHAPVLLEGGYAHMRLAVHTNGYISIGGSGFFAPNAGVSKFSQDGTLLWNRKLLAERVQINSLATDANGHTYAGGFFKNGSLRLEDALLNSHGNDQDGFVARYDAKGNIRWVGHISGPGIQEVTDITVAPSGDLYIAGKFTGTLRLGSKELIQMGNGINMFLAKYAASTITSSEAAVELPTAAALTSNYPNPFTHTTTIEYALPVSGPVRLAVYDALGREVATLVDGVRQAGSHVAVFDGTSLPSGVYLYRLEAAGQAKTGMMTLRK